MTEEVQPNEASNGLRPPYPGIGVFNSFVDRLAKNGVPSVIDRHFIGGSGTNQSLMQNALRYLGLVNEENQPQDDLHTLAEREDQRPATYRKLVEEHYSGALALGLRATQSQLDSWFRSQGVTG